MDLIRIVADTQVSTVACFIKCIILDHSSGTFCEIFDEADTSETDAARKLTLRNSATELTKIIIFPGRGLRLPTGCFIAYEAGEIFYAKG